MDNSWQMKCGSTWQPVMSSSSQEPRNQVWSGGHNFYPHMTQESSPAARGMLQEALVPKTSILCSDNSCHTDPGSLFLSLLSGPQSLLQCDLQQFSSPKPFVTSTKLPVTSDNFAGSASGNGVSLACTGIFSQNVSIQNPKIGADLCPVVSSMTMENANYGSGFSLLDVLQAANLNHQNSETAKAVLRHSDAGNEKERDFSSLSGEWLSSRSPANARKLQSTNNQALQNPPLETNSSISRHSSTIGNGCPRVFCLGASGDLLLSNTGLLGVVCSCHGLHMSISKFSVHSGLCDVNPGDAVHMDSGETIAQWRKLYFHKFGIRVPEDHSGWDWPEGFSATAGMVKHSMTVPNMSKNSDLSNLAGSSGGLVGFGQSQNNATYFKNPSTGQKLVNEVSYHGEQKNAWDSCNFLHKGLIRASHSNLTAVTNNQSVGCPMSGSSTMSKLAGVRGPDNGCHSVSAYIDSISKTGQSFISQQNLQNSKYSGVDSDVSRFYNLKKGNIVDRDAVSASIELRLGQPSSQSQTLGSSVLPAFRSHLVGTPDNPQKSRFPEQLIHNSNSREMEEDSRYLQHAADSSISYPKRGKCQLNFVKHAPGINNARHAAMTEQLKGDANRSSVIAKLLSQFETPVDGRMHTKGNGSEANGCHVMPRTLQCESHVAAYDQTKSLWNRDSITQSQLNFNKLGLQKHVDKGKKVAFADDGQHVVTEPNFEFHAKRMESSTNCNGVSGTGCHSYLAVHDKSFHPCHFSGMSADACSARNPFNHLGRVPCLGLGGHKDNVFLKSTRPLDSGQMLPWQAVSMGSSVQTSTSLSNMSPVFTNKEGSGVSPYLLDDNVRMLAFRHMVESSNKGCANASLGIRHMVESSNKGCANASLGIKQDQGRLNSSCEKIHGSIVNPSSSKEQRHGHAVTSKKVASEVVMKPIQTGFTCWMADDAENQAPGAGLNKWCNFSTFSPGTPFHSKNTEMQCQLSCDIHPNEQPSGRSGRIENDIALSNDCGKCCQRVPCTYFAGKCGCTVHTNCRGGNCNAKNEGFVNASKEWTGSLNGMASMFLAPKFKGDSTFPTEKAISFDQIGNLEGQVKKKVDYHVFQWRDVPSKAIGVPNSTCKDQSADLLDRKEDVGVEIADAAKCLDRSAQHAESSKEQGMSNISSGCSAAAVTQATFEVNNLGSSIVGAGDKYKQNLIVDEGSGIDKCWSSDDPPDSERSSEFFSVTCKINSASEGSSKPLPNQSSRSLIDELRLRDSLILKNVRNQAHTGFSIHENTSHTHKIERGFKSAKIKRPTKWKMLDASFPASGTGAHLHSHSAKETQLETDQGKSHSFSCSVGPSFKQRSLLCLTKTISRKRNLHGLYNEREEENDQIQIKAVDDCLETPEYSGRKRFRSGSTIPTVKQLPMQEPNCSDIDIGVKSNSANCMIISSAERVGICKGKERPVVCGKYGVISNGDSSRPAKIISLSKILKATRRYTFTESKQLKCTAAKRTRKRSINRSSDCIDKFSNFKERDSEGHDDTVSSEMNPETSVKESIYLPEGKERDLPYTLEEERDYGGERNHRILDSCLITRLQPKCKEIRKRSLYELSTKGKDSSCLDVSAIKTSKCLRQTKSRYLAKFLKNTEDGKCHADGICNAKFTGEHQCRSSVSYLDAFCCVCGSSNKDEINCLLECGRCLIRVHQACYGVSKVPRGRWYCRPCRTSSKNIVCVLCGYGGGAMTRALRSRNIVKSLLKAWNIVTESGPKETIYPYEVLEDRLGILSSSTSGLGSDSFPVIRPVPMKPSSAIIWKMDLQKQLACVNNSACSSSDLKVYNSITAGVLDSTVKQWVHMVCGLWTPGTRCPNVDTMSAFDVSGAPRPKANVVCSMCSRPGGSCIQCRVRNCSVHFHPWCAHQKGLLQSEIEGIDNENVGFYGRCVLHAAYHQCDLDIDPKGTEIGQPEAKEYTCARTEGYKGRKREGFRHNIPWQSSGSGGCVVPQEQLNAWLHINKQKSRPRGLPKLTISDVEYDCRKEYARYKQSKGWKHLVVYKSGIHALGLYTSQFISHGAMVVEYVGEIVGLRVADKREGEYQSGRKLQYKSACYFFRIDKEHIIDATRKGGIARFVNHSCLPNCVAKIISVRNEKKVVFFAERDIYPGEEITYDYHFNHEDEGEKIPCFCNSKNCRRYLN